MGGTEELRVMMAYAKRRRLQEERSTPKASDTEGSPAKRPSSPQTPAKAEKDSGKKKKTEKKRKGLKRLASIFSCIKPQTEKEEPTQIITNLSDVENRCFVPTDGEQTEEKEKDKLDEVAGRLTEIANKIPFIRPDLETDSVDDENVERVIGLLLRDVGDQLNEREQIDGSAITGILWDYGFFDKLITCLLSRMGLLTDPEDLGPKASTKAHIAVTCEVTSRLSAVDTLPMSRMLNYGARYLEQHFSSWALQQGGYEAAFNDEDESEDEVQ
ncbi:hypothetical protein L3Q82_000492 [Scortum barcoo]|uniref:Uncharacterized protein n=1 Tax=Scortum barcoo TaxID=214431 RepID=A0ACB8WF77_9TELE|nr:hypothetical protein L3Q82_000492 [Scortum barcoo]